MKSPRPRPTLVRGRAGRRNGSKIVARSAAGMGAPRLWTTTSASPPRSSARTVTVGVPVAVEIAVVLELDLPAGVREIHLVDHAGRDEPEVREAPVAGEAPAD